LFHEGAANDFDSRGILAMICMAAGHFGEWFVLLRTARRLFHLERRTGGVPRFVLGGILNLVARGLAVAEPGVAAVIQGSASGLINPPLELEMMTQTTARYVVGEILHETTTILIDSIGEGRMRELRARGAAMNPDQACAYARIHIDDYLAAEQRTAPMSPSPAADTGSNDANSD
jgi:hypothetical protein